MAEDSKTTDRILHSRQILSAWRQSGGPGGDPEHLMRMIREEIQILSGFIDQFPEKAETLGRLIEGWKALQISERKHLN